MKIKERDKQLQATKAKFFLFLLFYTVCLVSAGIWFVRSGLVQESKQLTSRLLWKLNKPNVSAPRMVIDIKFKDYKKLEKKRDKAVEKRILSSSSNDFVPAKISFGEKSVKARIRLKGDQWDHFEGDKWSFRIKLKGDETIKGMKVFSIHQPYARNYHFEWLYHKMLAKLGLINLRYSFVNVTVNGKDLGLYAMEEHFDKRLIEHNKRRDGPIVRFADVLFFEDFSKHYPEFTERSLPLSSSYRASLIDIFQDDQWVDDPVRQNTAAMALKLMEDYRSHKADIDSIFDLKQMGAWLAVCDLMGADHATHWQNLRMYFNPFTGLFEPIGYDADAGHMTKILSSRGRHNYFESNVSVANDFVAQLFESKKFEASYVQALSVLTKKEWLESFIAENKKEMQAILSLIRSDEFGFSSSLEAIFENRDYLKNQITPSALIQPILYSGNSPYLEVANLQEFSVEVVGIGQNNHLIHKFRDGFILNSRTLDDPLIYVNFDIPDNVLEKLAQEKSMTLACRLIGTEEIVFQPIFYRPFVPQKSQKSLISFREPNPFRHDFLSVDEASKTIRISKGSYVVDEDIVIPEGYTFIIEPGVQLQFKPTVNLICRSQVHFVGLANQPIRISSDGLGGAVVVLRAPGESFFKHVVFENLTEPNIAGLSLSGSVNLYESKVSIEDCSFKNCRSEDALNIFRSHLKMSRCQFIDAFSDGLDLDFCSGVMTDVEFVNCGNDGFDISGSNIRAEKFHIEECGDKGISVGEASTLKLKGLRAKNLSIAVAVKDSSQMTVTDVKISRAEVGFAIFQKKPEFSGASVDVLNSTIEAEVSYLLQNNCSFSVEGQNQASTHDDVESLLYGNEFGKSSK